VEEPGRNDPCWCGSGKKYKKCHRGLSEERRSTFGQIESRARKAWQRRECLHPSASPTVCTKVIDAHTVQRSGALGQIVGSDNKVLTFFPIRPDALGRLKPHSIGWRQASTFTGFCSVHDAVFAPVEARPFTATPEQCFLLSYRAVCFELYQKRGSERSNPEVLDLIQRGIPAQRQREVHAMMTVMQAGTTKGREDAEAAKSLMDPQLLSGDYNGWEWYVVDFTGPIQIATCGGVSPNRDLAGRSLQTLHNVNQPGQWLTVNIVPRTNGGSVVFGYRSSDTAPARFIADLQGVSDARLAQVLPQFVFAYIENSYFSRLWWDLLSDRQQKVIMRHAGNPNAYYDLPVYDPIDVVDWTISARSMVRVA
jgi:hypothetical protein